MLLYKNMWQKYFFKSAILFSLITIFLTPAFSEEFSFQLIPFSGLEISTIEELYYFEKSTYPNGHKLKSRLEWNQKPSFLIGLEGKINYKNTYLSVKGDVKMPLRCGSMYDSDYTESDMKFNYSINENTIVKGYDFAVALSHHMDLDAFILEPEISCNLSYIGFEARNGYGWYGNWEHTSDSKTHHWSDPEAHYYPDGKKHLGGVDYENNTISIFTGVCFSKTFFSRWENSIGFYVAPFTYIYAKDTHVGQMSFYTEDLIYTYFNNFKLCAKTGWKVSEKIKLQLLAQYEWCQESIGENYHTGYKNESDGGCAYNKFRLEFGIQYKLQKKNKTNKKVIF